MREDVVIASTHQTIQSDFAVVALLDALGTKGLLSRNAPDGLLETWQTLLVRLEQWCDEAEADESTESCSFLAFSDTALITIIPISEAGQPECLSLMHSLLQRVLWRGVLDGVYFRGAVSTGRFIQSPFRVLGESLEEAAEWYEQAGWMGVMATPSGKHLIEQIVLDGRDVNALFVRHDVPLRNSQYYATWVVNWPAFADQESKDENTSGKAKLLRSFRAYSGAISPAIVAKYTNTLTFADIVWDSASLESQP